MILHPRLTTLLSELAAGFTAQTIETLLAEQEQIHQALDAERLQALSHRMVEVQEAERALQQVRNLSLDLRPSLLDDLGLVPALRWYVNRQAERAGFTAVFTADSLEAHLSPDLEIACFRVVQEALTNAVRRAGAAGYLLKDADTSELELAVRAVARGETYLSPPVSKTIIEDYIRRVGGEPHSFDRLTPRQRKVLRLIAKGNTTKEIAQALNIGIKTVETHRAQVMKELGVHDIAGLVRYAIRVGLVLPDR